MAKRREIPRVVIQRLPLYLRTLMEIYETGDITSQELGRRVGLSSAQIRKDLSYFGGFGKQGAGYDIERLREALRGILNVDRDWEVALVGVGDLGHAIVKFGGFDHRGFRVVAAFDNDPAKIGTKVGSLVIQDVSRLEELIREGDVRVAILAVPPDAAQEVADALVRAGVKAILNYAPAALRVSPEVQVQHIDPLVGLQSMTFYLDSK